MTRMIKAGLLPLCCVLVSLQVPAQERLTEHTFSLTPGAQSPRATIDDMAWLAGHWAGEALGGLSEEIWSPPKGGTMMGIYRMIRDGKPVFYELLTIVEEKGSLMLRLKHFNADLTGWEEKDVTVDFPLVAKGERAVHFDGMSFHVEGDDAMTIYLAMRQKDGSASEAVFRHKRVLPGG